VARALHEETAKGAFNHDAFQTQGPGARPGRGGGRDQPGHGLRPVARAEGEGQHQHGPGLGARNPAPDRAVAQRIIDFRTKNGGFKKIEEIMKVQGIGEKVYENIKDLITVGGETAPK
jgi:hypothetical protein